MRTARPGLYRWWGETAGGGSAEVRDSFNIPSPRLRLKVANVQSLSGIVACVSSSFWRIEKSTTWSTVCEVTVQKLGSIVKFIRIGVR
jgi:hypothetical protein